jgi:hypothetical protein
MNLTSDSVFGDMPKNEVTAFWNIAPCSLVQVDRRFRCAYYHHQDDKCRNVSQLLHSSP